MKRFNGLCLPSEAVSVKQMILHVPSGVCFLAIQTLGDGSERCELLLTGETFTADDCSLGIGQAVSRIMQMRGVSDRREMRVTTAWQHETRHEWQASADYLTKL